MYHAKKNGLAIDWKAFAPSLILVVNTFVWYTLTFAAFTDGVGTQDLSFSETVLVFGFFFAAIAVSAIIGSLIPVRVRRRLLLLWVIAGVASTALSTTIQSNTLLLNGLVSLLLGASTGIGLPSCLSYFADSTDTENRGLHGGIIWGGVGAGTLVLAVLVSSLDIVATFEALAVWRMIGLAFFLFSEVPATHSVEAASYRRVMRARSVLLYLAPWIMFSLINSAEAPIVGSLFGDSFVFIGFVEVAISGSSAIVAGLLSDYYGRKRVVITGFIMIGMEYAVLSLFSGHVFSAYIYTALDGIAWGMFASVFFMSIWGDLAERRSKEKYYTVGGLVYVLSNFVSIVVQPYVFAVPLATAFSIASFFLFIAVLPLMYAPETLPEKRIKQRELQVYVDKAQKIREKYA